MKVFSNSPVSFFDVDNTLVMFDEYKEVPGKKVDIITNNGEIITLTVHTEHIEILKQLKNRGYTIVIWSAGGSNWAEKVIMSLGIENYIDLIIPKPQSIFDDLELSEFLPGSRYINKNKYLGDL